MARARQDEEDLDEVLGDLEVNIKRLKTEYDQYFMGVLKRAPVVLQGKVQKVILRLASKSPRSTRHKFRFNQLNSRYQVLRQQWGRILRDIERGTYKPHLFQADLHERRRLGADAAAQAKAEATRGPGARAGKNEGKGAPAGKPMDRLLDALASARDRTGEGGAALDRTRMEQMVRKQTAAIRAKHKDAKIRFKVVIEDNKAKLKASVGRD